MHAKQRYQLRSLLIFGQIWNSLIERPNQFFYKKSTIFWKWWKFDLAQPNVQTTWQIIGDFFDVW